MGVGGLNIYFMYVTIYLKCDRTEYKSRYSFTTESKIDLWPNLYALLCKYGPVIMQNKIIVVLPNPLIH